MGQQKPKIYKMKEYKDWIKSISSRYRQCVIKAAVSVNQELISFYWNLGKEIAEREAERKYGSDFYTSLSKDLKKALPGDKGFASTNLRYMVKFYLLYSGTNLPQVVGDFQKTDLFSIPWGHHRLIIDRCKGNKNKAVFFVKKTIQNNWSRSVLEHFLDTDLYTRQGKSISNFAYTLPEPQRDLAQEITKDPYNFNFLSIQDDYNEKQLKDTLVDNVIKFLLELGKGFAFVGKEYALPINGTEEYIDLLFYHLWLHCYVVVEIKIKAFSAGDVGQTAAYVAVADDLIRRNGDNKTIGLIICKSKNNILAKYAAGTSKEPIGISEYELSNFLPTPEEIEKKLIEGFDADSKD